MNKVVKSHHIVSIVIIICILVFPIAITEKVTVYALAPGSNHSSSSSFTAGMMHATQGQQQQLLQSKINMVKLLADMVENRLQQASVLLEITSVDPVVQKNLFVFPIQINSTDLMPGVLGYSHNRYGCIVTNSSSVNCWANSSSVARKLGSSFCQSYVDVTAKES